MWLFELLFFPKTILPRSPAPENSAVSEEASIPELAPVGDGKFKDRAEELMVPLNWVNVTFKKEVADKGKSLIDTLPLKSYSEHSDCDIQAGISVRDFPKTVELIAKDLKLPDELKDRMINVARTREGDSRSLGQAEFTTEGGRFYFGKIAVVKKEDGFLDMSYSLITIKYKINRKARNAQLTEQLLASAAGTGTAKDALDLEASDFFKFSDVDTLNEYFQFRAAEEFVSKCQGPRRGLPTPKTPKSD